MSKILLVGCYSTTEIGEVEYEVLNSLLMKAHFNMSELELLMSGYEITSKDLELFMKSLILLKVIEKHYNISNYPELKEAINKNFINMTSICMECNKPDCLGVIWTLPSEVDVLLEEGVELLKINENTCVLHLFPENEQGVGGCQSHIF